MTKHKNSEWWERGKLYVIGKWLKRYNGKRRVRNHWKQIFNGVDKLKEHHEKETE